MIKKLRRKFILITMCSLLAVVTLLVGAINAINLFRLNADADKLLNILSQNDGRFPEGDAHRDAVPPPGETGRAKLGPETKFETRWFTVELSPSGEAKSVDTGHVAAVSSSQALEYAAEVFESEQTSGFSDVYKFRVCAREDGSLQMIFLDCRTKLNNALSLFLISLAVAAAGLLLVFALVCVFSGRAVKPIALSAERQKQFITDAGHEIKTPLAIISANADVIELEHGESEWTRSIKNQTVRLDGLVRDLLTLSQMDEEGFKPNFQSFNLSELAEAEAEDFKAAARLKNISVSLIAPPDITIRADRESIAKLIGVLLDNAVKYADGGTEISIELSQNGKTARLAVKNSCADMPEGDLKRLFDRFYRANLSRSGGGYGIGLSIAQAAVRAHGGRISAFCPGKNEICFEVKLPLNN